MAKVNIYNMSGEKSGELELSDKIFAATASPELVHQLVTMELTNRRNTVAATKTRADVRGGGKKPWRQKGTGRARAGSIRSPLWKGGGVVFGPRSNRNFLKKVNRSQFKKGLSAVLSDKLADKSIFVFSELSVEDFKTKKLAEILKNIRQKLQFDDAKVTIIASKIEKQFAKSASNLPNVEVLKFSQITPYNLLRSNKILLLKDAVEALEKVYAK